LWSTEMLAHFPTKRMGWNCFPHRQTWLESPLPSSLRHRRLPQVDKSPILRQLTELQRYFQCPKNKTLSPIWALLGTRASHPSEHLTNSLPTMIVVVRRFPLSRVACSPSCQEDLDNIWPQLYFGFSTMLPCIVNYTE